MGGVARALARRAVQAGTVVVVVGLFSFLLVRLLPGDQAMQLAERRYGEDRVSAATADAVRAELGLDRPAVEQFLAWLGRLLRGDLGTSFVSGERVSVEIAHQLGATLLLAFAALAFAALLGPLLGAAAGLRPGGVVDRVGTALAAAFRALPVFVVAVGSIVIFAATLGWLPAAGFDEGSNLVLPAASLGLGLAAVTARVTRDAVVAATNAPYFGFARLRGLTRGEAALRHVPRNAAIPVLAFLAVNLALLVEGVVVVEALFAWPGIGHALTHAVIARDVPMLQGTALTLGLVFVLLNAIVDLLGFAIDPRRAP